MAGDTQPTAARRFSETSELEQPIDRAPENRMSVSGYAGSLPKEGGYGAFRTKVRLESGEVVDAVVKIYPAEDGAKFNQEVVGAHAAANTGMGPEFYGRVPVPNGPDASPGTNDLAFAMEPVEGIAADPTYLDVSVPPGKRRTLPVESMRHAFAYVFGGSGTFCNASAPLAVPTEGIGWWPHSTPPAHAENRSLVLFDSGDEIEVQGGENGIRFLLVSGQPLEEPVAWYGPIVMNTQAELQKAFDELERGTFLKDDHSAPRVTSSPEKKA
jgi:hypothetical protein